MTGSRSRTSYSWKPPLSTQQLGTVSSETQIIRGLWQHEEQSYQDELIRVFVDVPDLPENRQFFVEFKERVKERFKQIDIWMTTYPIEVI